MSDRCRWIHDREIGRWHLPGCWGAVNAGPDGCYCDAASEDDEPSLEDRLASIEAQLSQLIAAAPAAHAPTSSEEQSGRGKPSPERASTQSPGDNHG